MPARRTRTVHAPAAAWPQAVAVLAGVLFAVIGVVGFAATGLDGFVRHDDRLQLFGLAANPLQNLLHVAVGVAGIVLSARLSRARVFGWLLAVGFGALFGYGVLAIKVPAADVLNLNWPDNWLHLAFAVLGVVIAVGPAAPPADRATR